MNHGAVGLGGGGGGGGGGGVRHSPPEAKAISNASGLKILT